MLRKAREVKMALFNLLQQNISVKLDIIQILKQFSLQLGEAGAAE